MNTQKVIVLAMHGAPPSDFSAEAKQEFFGLHARAAHLPPGVRPPWLARYRELENDMRAWPRTEQNDPFWAGARALAEALSASAGCPVLLGFNEFCAPSLEDALETAAHTAAEVVVLTPMMTRGGEHSEKDIPQAVERARKNHPAVVFRYVWPFPIDAIAAFLKERIA